MKINLEFIHREIMGDHVLVPVGKTSSVYNGLFPLTETGAYIWELLPEAENDAYIVNKLLEEYDVDRATAEADVTEFLKNLREFRIID